MMKWAITILPWALASQKSAFAQTVFQCSICGEGKVVTISDGIVTIPQNGDFICSDLEAYGEQGGFDAQTCVILESFVQTPCGCVETVPINGTATPTQSLTIAPTFGPEPDCYEDLDNLNQREISLSLQEIQIGRTYILCPGTVFFMGRLNQNNEFENGFSAIVPRPNVHYKCGDSGSSANNCRLLDGNYPIISLSDDEQHTNVTFQGLTIESAAQGGVLAVMPGDLTFLDCIFKNHENSGPVQIIFESSTSLTTLTVAFKQCIFEGNKLVSNFANPGIITNINPETILIFEDVIFRNNDYGDITQMSSAAAILSAGPLTLRNTCFTDNSFIRDAAVIHIGTSNLDVSNNHISPVDDQLTCPFVITYPDEAGWQGGANGTCTVAEADSCQSDIPPVAPPTISPDDQPTRVPVPRVTLAPVVPPSGQNPSRPSSSAPTSLCLHAIYMVTLCTCGLM